MVSSARAGICSSDQIPKSSDVLRPSGAIAVASMKDRPGPRDTIPPTKTHVSYDGYLCLRVEITYYVPDAKG